MECWQKHQRNVPKIPILVFLPTSGIPCKGRRETPNTDSWLSGSQKHQNSHLGLQETRISHKSPSEWVPLKRLKCYSSLLQMITQVAILSWLNFIQLKWLLHFIIIKKMLNWISNSFLFFNLKHKGFRIGLKGLFKSLSCCYSIISGLTQKF